MIDDYIFLLLLFFYEVLLSKTKTEAFYDLCTVLCLTVCFLCISRTNICCCFENYIPRARTNQRLMGNNAYLNTQQSPTRQ